MQEQFDIRPRRSSLDMTQPEFVDALEPVLGRRIHVAIIGVIEDGTIGIDHNTYVKFHDAMTSWDQARKLEAEKCERQALASAGT